jgi:transposase InsO family protein
MDIKRYPRFRRPGHGITGDRRRSTKDWARRLGHDYFHAVVDDHSRLAYGELLDDEKADTVTAFTGRALAWFQAQGITPRRLMTDGAWAYRRNKALRELLTTKQITHIVTPPYTPRWNGKVERFHQTMEREWAKGVRYNMINVLELPSEDVAIALGHTDGGELVRKLYGHRDRERALDRVTAAYARTASHSQMRLV